MAVCPADDSVGTALVVALFTGVTPQAQFSLWGSSDSLLGTLKKEFLKMGKESNTQQLKWAAVFSTESESFLYICCPSPAHATSGDGVTLKRSRPLLRQLSVGPYLATFSEGLFVWVRVRNKDSWVGVVWGSNGYPGWLKAQESVWIMVLPSVFWVHVFLSLENVQIISEWFSTLNLTKC